MTPQGPQVLEIIDGEEVLVVYLNDAFEPVAPAEATLLKVWHADGRVVFATARRREG